MSNTKIPSIETLPVELLYRILDNLDTQTILFSIRPVCHFLHSVVNTYNRYILDFTSYSKSNVNVFCRLIDPENVISLRLSNTGQTSESINLFISLVNLHQFARLRSLTLFNINEGHLIFMLKQMNFNCLTALVLSIRRYKTRHRYKSINLLSSIVAKPTFHRLELYIPYDRKRIKDEFYTILQYSIHLHTLILNNIPTDMRNNLTSLFLPQLKSLTIKELWTTIDNLELFLLRMSSIVYLKLIGGENMMDGYRWKKFITMNLPQLDKFQFYFRERNHITQTEKELELIISLFQTPFWIIKKKWFVTIECSMESRNNIILYSIPICKYLPTSTINSQKYSLSNYPLQSVHDESIDIKLK